MKKFIRAVIIILGFVVASSGAIETVNSTVKEFTTEQTQSEQEEQTRDTYEGLIQVGAGSFIMLLTRFLENNKDKVSKYEIKEIDSKIKINLSSVTNEYNLSPINNKIISEQFNRDNTKLIYVLQSELGDILSQAIRIKNICYDVDNSNLFFKVYIYVLTFANNEETEDFLKCLKKFLEKFHELKMDHITESMAKKILDKSALPYDFFNGAGFKESISSCIEQEVLDVRVGKKLVNDVESYFNYPKTFTAKVV